MSVTKGLTLLSLAAALCQIYTEGRLRDKVIQIGTTLGPNFHRIGSKRKAYLSVVQCNTKLLPKLLMSSLKAPYLVLSLTVMALTMVVTAAAHTTR